MACDTAFRIIARRHLDAVMTEHDATCRGDVDALHQIRIALTHLRTAIRFFSPMVDDAVRSEVWAELKWLNGQLGLVRDLDVAIERMTAASRNAPALTDELKSWNDKRAESHRLLARALQSARYRRLVERTASWIESGLWSTKRSKDAIRLRGTSLGAHATERIQKWEKALLKRSRRLDALSVEKRHRVRLLNKRLTYSIESLDDLFSDGSLAEQKAALKLLRKAQRCLGQLNDDARGQALAGSLDGEKVETGFHFLGHKRKKQLLRDATIAYRKLGKSKTLRV